MFTSLLVGLTLTIAAPAPKEEAKKDKEPAKLEGEWVLEKVEGPKEDAPPGSVRLVFAGGKVSVFEGAKDRAEVADYSVDDKQKPPQMDIMPGKGDKKVLGIYEISGDTMKLCFARDGKDRPKEFKGDAANGIMMMTLKKVKADK